MFNYGRRLHNEDPSDPAGTTDPAAGTTDPAAGTTDPAAEPNWRDTISEEYRSAPSLQSHKDLNSLIKSHLSLESLQGQSLRIPTEDAGDEAWNTFYDKVRTRVPKLTTMPNPDDEQATKAFWQQAGVPENLEGYTLPEGAKPDVLTGLNEVARKAGLTVKQFQKLALEMQGAKEQEFEQQQTEHTEAMNKLNYEWGMAKEDKMTSIKQLLSNTGAPEQLAEAVATGNVGPDFLKWADSLVKAIGSEGANLTKNLTQSSDFVSPEEAQARIDEIMGNREGAYWNNRDPLHKSTIAKVVKLKGMVIAGQK